MFNWIKRFFCKLPKHDPLLRYNGMNVQGYVCTSCGYKWYEGEETGGKRMSELDKDLLCDKLTNMFINYQHRLDTPFLAQTETKAIIVAKYLSDPLFNAKVKAMVYGVLRVVDDVIRESK